MVSKVDPYSGVGYKTNHCFAHPKRLVQRDAQFSLALKFMGRSIWPVFSYFQQPMSRMKLGQF